MSTANKVSMRCMQYTVDRQYLYYCPNYNLFNGAGLPASPFRTDDWP